MKILNVSTSDIVGGAARAAYRLHRTLLAEEEESRMLVRSKNSGDLLVDGPISTVSKEWGAIRPAFGGLVLRLQHNSHHVFRSVSCLPSRWATAINESNADVVNLHWVAGEAMSIEDIGRIRKPVVWTLHDMWPFCGTEHYAPDGDDTRWKQGYAPTNRPEGQTGIDLDRWAWHRKVRAWCKPIQIITPSHWLSRCVAASALMRDWPVATIPNVLDTDTYKPVDRGFARAALNLPQDKTIVLFGAIAGGVDPRKGYDLLLESLRHFSRVDDAGKSALCVVFGQLAPPQQPNIAIPMQWMGHIHDDVTLALLYSAANVMVVPSRQEAFGQTASEALACGCPVVAFDATGLVDVVDHKVTGYLAKAFDEEDLAHGISWVLEDKVRWKMLSDASRQRAVQLWSPTVVVPQYQEIYRATVKAHC